MELKQAIIVNKGIKMGVGKIAGQCCHGETLYMKHIHSGKATYETVNRYYNWLAEEVEPIGLMKKIVLKATKEEMEHIISVLNGQVWFALVFDKGLTQISPESNTCIIVEPLPEEEYDKLFRHLKLL